MDKAAKALALAGIAGSASYGATYIIAGRNWSASATTASPPAMDPELFEPAEAAAEQVSDANRERDQQRRHGHNGGEFAWSPTA